MERSLKSESFLEELSWLVCVVRFELEFCIWLVFVGVFLGSVRNPDLRPGTPTAPLGFFHGHEPHACDCGPSRTTISRYRTAEHPSLQHAGTQADCDPQLISPSLAAGVF